MSGLDLSPPTSSLSAAKESSSSLKDSSSHLLSGGSGSGMMATSTDAAGGGATAMHKEEPHALADQVYEAICKDTEEKPTAKGQQAFRDKVFENCTTGAIVLHNARIGAHACITLVKYMKTHAAQVTVAPGATSPERPSAGGAAAAAPTKSVIGVPGGRRFHRLDLTSNNLQNYGVFELLKIVRLLPSVKHVNLSCNNIGNKGGVEVAKFLAQNESLLTLELGSTDACFKKNHLEAKSTIKLAIALCRNKTLQYLGLRHNEFSLKSADAAAAQPIAAGTQKDTSASAAVAGLKSAETFAVMLQRNKTLTAINFDSCALGTRGAAVIVAALAHNTSLRHLNLASNGIDANLGRTLEQVLAVNHALCSLNLAHNDLGSMGVQQFAPALVQSNQSLLVIDLEGNGIGDAGAETLAVMLQRNRTITSLNVALNGITERGGKAIADSLGANPVLTSLNLSANAVKNVAIMSIAESLLQNRSLLTLDVCSCKVGDEGVIALVSAIGNNEAITLRKLRVRDNYISGAAGELIVDSLYRNTSLTVADFRGNQIDHVRLNKVRIICKRNLDEIKDAEPRRLRKEIARLRGEQVKLRKAETTLKNYQSSIADTRAKIDVIEKEKAAFLASQHERREEIRAQIAKELAAIKESKLKLDEKKRELGSIESTYTEKLSDLQKGLALEVESRKTMEGELVRVKKELEETIKDRPNKIQELKDQIEVVKTEKTLFQTNLTNIRKELLRLQQSYHDGHPIPNLIEQAKALLVTYQSSMPQPSSFVDSQQLKAKEAEEKAAADARTLAATAEQLQAAAAAAAAAAEAEQPTEEDPDEDPEMRELRLMVEEQMRNK